MKKIKIGTRKIIFQALKNDFKKIIFQNRILRFLLHSQAHRIYNMNIKRFIFLFFFGFYFGASAQEIKLSVFRTQGEGVAWSLDGKKIVYDTKGAKPHQYYELHIADTDGSHDTCISSINPDIPHRHTGSPDWHPSGKYILFVAEQAVHPGGSVSAIPGFGAYSDIWVMTRNAKHAYKLTNEPCDKNHGIIGPHFSHDGKHIVWVERKRAPNPFKKKCFFGFWVIKTADFIVDSGIPKLMNIKTFEPVANAFYETYGYTADDKNIIFCSNMRVNFWWECGIFTINALTGNVVRQLTTNDYNEHAVCAPNGKWIIWMSNTMATKQGTDWWIMNPDGSCKQRLTYFNEPGNPEYNGHKRWAGLTSFSSDCKHFVGGVQNSLLKQEGSIYKVDFLPSGNGNGLEGTYFQTEDFSGAQKSRIDPAVNYRWGKPWHDTLVSGKKYSVRWTGFVQPLYSETYTFYTPADKNIFVWINDTLVIGSNTPKNKYKEKISELNLEAGKKYSIRVEYHNTLQKKATVFLYWSSLQQYKQAIPASQLFTDNKEN
ncbi:MAG: PA14 domain-containing protein [Bacteroidia bacterium]